MGGGGGNAPRRSASELDPRGKNECVGHENGSVDKISFRQMRSTVDLTERVNALRKPFVLFADIV